MHTGSKVGSDQAKMWLQTCDDMHTACHRIGSAQARQLPTRVLDVSGQNPFLYTAQPGECGDYVCLSHCWGPGRPLVTETSTLKAHLSSIPLAGMPATFRDAVDITRGPRPVRACGPAAVP